MLCFIIADVNLVRLISLFFYFTGSPYIIFRAFFYILNHLILKMFEIWKQFPVIFFNELRETNFLCVDSLLNLFYFCFAARFL